MAGERETVSGDVVQCRSARGRVTSLLDNLIARAQLRMSPLGRDIQKFSRGLEECIFPAPSVSEDGRVRIGVEAEEDFPALNVSGGDVRETCSKLKQLPVFLQEIGIRAIVCDRDLESNQISDVLHTLWQLRGSLRHGGNSKANRVLGRGRLTRRLLSQEGLHMSCATISMDSKTGVLNIRNSYCELAFSRFVNAYMSRGLRFKDHRAFFYAAPRYAIVAMLLTLLPLGLAALFGVAGVWLAGIVLIVSLLVGLGTYVVFRTIAAVEYDKEHQARQLKHAHADLVGTYKAVQRDLKTAHTIQRTLLPDVETVPLSEHVAFAHSHVPEMAVGGDHYDIKALDDHRVAMMLADVSGHGMSAAFVTGLIKTGFELAFTPDQTPGQFMGTLNNLLARLTPPASFAAVIVAVYDISSGAWQYVNAGHGPVPVVVRRAGNIEVLFKPVDLLAGVDPDVTYEIGEVRLEPGDKVVLSTDGITDCVNLAGERWGMKRYDALIHASVDLSAAELRDRIVRALAEHAGDAQQNDDRAILVMEVLE